MSIDLTNKAIEKINKIVEEEKIEKPVIRVYIAGVGWGGPAFSIALDEHKDEDYSKFLEGVTYVAEKELVNKYGGFKVDYSDSWLTKGFKINATYGGSRC